MPMILYSIDNKGAVDLANNWSCGGCTWHIKLNCLCELRKLVLLKLYGSLDGILILPIWCLPRIYPDPAFADIAILCLKGINWLHTQVRGRVLECQKHSLHSCMIPSLYDMECSIQWEGLHCYEKDLRQTIAILLFIIKTKTYTGVTVLFAETVLLRQLEARESNTFWCRQLSLITVFQIPVIYPYYSPVLAVFRSENFAGRPHFSGRQTAWLIDSIFYACFAT